jgi:PAS domain S-box-containing protein
MDRPALNILVVDDVVEYAEMVREFIRGSGEWAGAETAIAASYDDALRALTQKPYDVAFVDYRLGARDGVALLRDVRSKGIDTPVVILTGHGDEHVAVEAMKAGAADYLGKMQVSGEALDRAIRHAIALHTEEQQRRQAEAALRANEERFRALVENSSDALLLLDPEARVQYVAGSERHLGWTSDQMQGRSIFEFLHSDDHAAVTAAIDRLSTPGGSVALEVRVRHADRRFRIMETVAVNHLDEPAVGAIVVNARDITERRRLEDQLQHVQKMEAVGQLAGGVAHDFNNLLTVILGYCNLMLEDVPPEDPLREDLAEIRSAGEKALSLTRQLLAFSRRQVLQPQVVDLNGLIHQIERLLRRLVTAQVDLVLALAGDLNQVRVDPTSMEQVLVNLAANARDAMPLGGRVTIETANVEMPETNSPDGTLPAGSYVQLSVHDGGPVMDGPTRARIFEPFFAAGEHGKRGGLGLASVYGIVKQNGGYVWADADASAGTVFRIFFPRAESSVATPPEPHDAARTQSWETVLLVDDENAVRALAREVLRREGYTVLEARHAVDALRMAERHRDEIHLMIANAGMSRMSGRELARRLSTARPRMKVLFLAGQAEAARLTAEIAGASVLPRPFAPEALARKVREMLDRTDTLEAGRSSTA